MFDVGFGEFLVIAIIALFVFGPDRLPKAAAQAGRVLRELRTMATGARQELSEHLELDPELASLDLSSLDPRQIVRRTLLEDEPSALPTNGAVQRPRPQRPMRDGERPPYDPDAT